LEGIKVMKKLIPVIVLVFGIFLLVPLSWAGTGTVSGVEVEPNQVLMGASFNGARITVSGLIPAECEVLVRFLGAPQDLRLKKKGRALGLLWMNMGAVYFHNAPGAFLLFPSRRLENFMREKKEEWDAMGLGFEGLKEQLNVSPASENKDLLFAEFMKLRQKERLYGIIKNTVTYGKMEKEMKPFAAVLTLPPDIPQGAYRIEVFAIKGGKVISSQSREIAAKEVGVPAMLASLAFEHGTLYGVIAVIVAVLAGLLSGLIFKGAKGAH